MPMVSRIRVWRRSAPRSTCAIAVIGAIIVWAPAGAQIMQPADAAWADDPNVQAVIAQREIGLEAMTSGRISAETERYSSTFVANTPNNSVVSAEPLLQLFASGTFGYAKVEQYIEYAGSHGDDLVVIMGEEIVVPLAGAQNAGQRIRRRFTDIFRREDGEWRHDVRHANALGVDDDGDD